MKHTLIYLGIASLALATGACTDETDSGRGQEPQGTPIAIQAGVRSGETGNDDAAYKAFDKGKQIHVYYAYNNLNDTYDFLQGIYEMPESTDKTTPWNPIEWAPEEGADNIKSIYVEDIKGGNYNGKYYFTATSYPEPWVKGQEGAVYEVPANQSTLTGGFDKYDFLAARAIYQNADWKNKDQGITLHFRHLLCQLQIQLFLPEGTEADGLFPKPKEAKIEGFSLLGKKNKYTVTYSHDTEAKGIFGTSCPNDKQETDLTMCNKGVSDKEVTINGQKGYIHTFSAILPKQEIFNNKLISFKINGNSYSYTPPEANTVLLQQEKITIIQLTVLSGIGNQKVMLNSVTLKDWIADRADVGDLILN